MDTLQTIGAILGILSSITLGLLAFFDKLPGLIHNIKSMITWAMRLPTKAISYHNDLRWSKEYGPTWRIVSLGSARISQVKDNYMINLKMSVEYSSRDPRYKTRIDCMWNIVDMYNNGKGRDKYPYRLSSGSPGIIMLTQQESRVVDYEFRRQEPGKPLLKETTICKTVNIGIASLEHVTKDIVLPSQRFEVEVEYI